MTPKLFLTSALCYKGTKESGREKGRRGLTASESISGLEGFIQRMLFVSYSWTIKLLFIHYTFSWCFLKARQYASHYGYKK